MEISRDELVATLHHNSAGWSAAKDGREGVLRLDDDGTVKRALKKLEKAGVEAFHLERLPQDDRLRWRSYGQVLRPESRKRTWYWCPNGCSPKTDTEEALELLDKP